MNISYFSPQMSKDSTSKVDKGLINPSQLKEGAQKRAQKIEQSKKNTGLMSKNEERLLTNDGREIFNENN